MALEPHAKRIISDPVLTAVIANRLDGIVREMENTMLRSARSAIIAAARDFSCVIITADNQLLSTAEALPVHIFGSHLQSQSMCDLHPDLAEGDAYLHNDPYLGNTHAADHTILVPVFFEGEHLFTASAKAHQADCGNSIPSTYVADAKDVYAEGSLIFPCVRVQRNYVMNDDLVRMCKARIRVPEQWHGDFLAAIGAARIAERRLKELCAKYGREAMKDFARGWLDYSEELMKQEIRKMPAGCFTNHSAHDPLPGIAPDGIPIKLTLEVKPEEALIEIDLRDNIDCLDCGLNQSEACSLNNVIAGIFNCVDPEIPNNSGAFRRFKIHLRDGCVVGRPSFPHSCSVATTNLAGRLVNLTQRSFAELGDGHGLAEGGCSVGMGYAVVSGNDFRRGGQPYINQLFASLNGGPGGPKADGWASYAGPQSPGSSYRDSVELDEIKHPILVKSLHMVPGSGGAGRMRGAPASQITFGTRRDVMTAIVASDCNHYPSRGVRGGEDGARAASFKIDSKGREERLPNAFRVELEPGEWLRGYESGGGGYGDPLERDPARVLNDVLEGWETVERARDVYGVAFTGVARDETLAVDDGATEALRRAAKARKAEGRN
jgi:N-methylhydantoinase B